MLEGDMARRLWNAVDEEHALRPIIPHRALSEARLSDEGWPILPTNPLQPAKTPFSAKSAQRKRKRARKRSKTAVENEL